MVTFLADQLLKISEWFVDNQPEIDIFAEAMGKAWAMILSMVVFVWTLVEPILDLMVDGVLKLGTAALEFATGDWEGAWETVKSIVKDAKEAGIEIMQNYILGLLEMFGEGGEWHEFAVMWAGNWDNLLLIVTGKHL